MEVQEAVEWFLNWRLENGPREESRKTIGETSFYLEDSASEEDI